MKITRAHFALPRPALATLLLGLAMTAFLFQAIRSAEDQRATRDFERRAGIRIVAVKQGLEQMVQELQIVNRLFVTVPTLDREQFRVFTAPLLAGNPQQEVLSYHRLVSEAERDAFEAGRRRVVPGFTVKELAGGKLRPAPRRPQYRIIDYLEPLNGNSQLLGLDASSRVEQREALERACRTGKPAMTAMYDVLVGNSFQPGFAILMPLYRPGAVQGPGGARCDQVSGYTAIGFGTKGLLSATLNARRLLDRQEIDIAVYASRGADPKQLVFRTSPGREPAAAAVSENFEVAGLDWHIAVARADEGPFENRLGSWLMLLCGTLGSMLAAAYIAVLALRSRSVSRMVDQRTAALREANQTLQLLQQAIDACLNSIIIIRAAEPDYPVEYVNPAFEKITGYSAAEVTGRSCGVLLGADFGQSGARALRSLVSARREGNATLRTFRKDGTLLWSDVHIAPVRTAGGAVTHFVVAQYDVTDKKRYAEELEYQASHDTLTGLVNRALLRDRLSHAIASAARRKRMVWTVFVDLDRFKFVNDSLGHRAGDELLKEIAARLAAAVRASDTVARLGGDEFVLVLSEDAGGAPNVSALKRVMDVIARPVRVDTQQFFLGCSVGVAVYPDDAADADTLVEFADLAMYRAKQQGGNNYQFYQPEMNQRAQERLQLERALRNALERAEFELRYQPEVELASGRVTGVEVMLFWHHPELGELPFARFGALAEETGLIVPIGAWLLRAACLQAAQWQRDGLGEPRIAVGVGARQFNEPGLAASVAAVLDESGLAPHCLELELSESLLMSDPERSVERLKLLRGSGVLLAIDDFGSGHSSLSGLKQFPIHTLKIDRSLVAEIAARTDQAAVAGAIISMAHGLGLRVVAEGVETETQCEYLAANMCDEIQGPLFSPSLPPAELAAMLREARGLPQRLLRMHKRQRTLLLVDDEPNILAALKRQLRGAGHRILTAPSGPDGLALLATEEIDVILSDQRMPGMTGVEFLRAVKTSHPDTVRMVLSGFTELQSVTDAVNEGAIYKFLTKPWDDTQLREHIDEAFAHKEMADENRRLDLEVRTANFGLAQANRQLGEVLQQQQEQIRHNGVSLEIVRELLQHVPQPIVGVDEDQVVAFANQAAQSLFSRNGLLLGNAAALFMPGVLLALQDAADGQPCIAELDGAAVEVLAHSMGKGTQSRGKLIIFTTPAAPGLGASIKEATQ